jgi:hypothetical protein
MQKYVYWFLLDFYLFSRDQKELGYFQEDFYKNRQVWKAFANIAFFVKTKFRENFV